MTKTLKKWIIYLTAISLVIGIIVGLVTLTRSEGDAKTIKGNHNTVLDGNNNRINSDNNIYIFKGDKTVTPAILPNHFSKQQKTPIYSITPKVFNGNKLAIMPFENISNIREYSWFSSGLAESLIESFSQNSKYVLIEANQRNKILNEIEFQQGKYVDINTAVKVGRLLGATQVVIGSFQISEKKIHITSRIVDVELGTIRQNSIVTLNDSLGSFFDIQKKYAELVKSHINE